MNSLRYFPLGEPITESPHAIASSLPTFEDVCGYEECDERVLSAVKVGYPRFVLHPYVRQLTDLFLERRELADRFGVLVANLSAAQDLLEYTNFRAVAAELEDGLQAVTLFFLFGSRDGTVHSWTCLLHLTHPQRQW